MCRGLVHAAFVILGKQEGVYMLSNSDLSSDALQRAIKKTLREAADECIIFVDCLGSSYTAAKYTCEGAPVIAGVNLPMLLSFFTKRDRMRLPELVETVIADGKKGILMR